MTVQSHEWNNVWNLSNYRSRRAVHDRQASEHFEQPDESGLGSCSEAVLNASMGQASCNMVAESMRRAGWTCETSALKGYNGGRRHWRSI
jgi:hypothetical protein